MNYVTRVWLLVLVLLPELLLAQEHIAPLLSNEGLKNVSKPVNLLRPTNLTLPFFEDFTDYSPFPNADKWEQQYVFVNNTMCINPVSRGVATFDALNEKGDLYPQNTWPTDQFYADTLTSKPIDLSTHTVGDSIYLSFFYQSKGNGFAPKPTDSLILHLLKSNGTWQHTWAINGNNGSDSFIQIMIPVTDTGYFNNQFRMRWINYATKSYSNSNWHLDYIKMDVGRTKNDTILKDIAFSAEPYSILNDFYAMPFSHFKTNANSFLHTELVAPMRNNGTNSINANVGYKATVDGSGVALGSATGTASMIALGVGNANFTMYNAGNYTPPVGNNRVVYNNEFYSNSQYAAESKVNDTILHQQIFDNYFAYDDGSAEKAYFLKLFGTAPGQTAIEYALYHADTLRGVAIRFAREVPQNTGKEFAIAVYKSIAFGGGNDELIYQEDALYPAYVDSVDKFTFYPFSQPQLLQAGTFFISIIQAAGGTSDSLHIALDVNRVGANHRYFKVEDTWESSELDGALMVRPIVGAEVALSVDKVAKTSIIPSWNITPNPVVNELTVGFDEHLFIGGSYQIVDLTGKILSTGMLVNKQQKIDVHGMPTGLYLLRIITPDGMFQIKRFSKL